MDIRIEEQTLCLTMEAEELKMFAKNGVAYSKLAFGPEDKMQLSFEMRLSDEFEIQSENGCQGLLIHLGIPTEDIINLVEMTTTPVLHKKISCSYPCSIDSENGLHRIDFELDTMSLKEQLHRVPEHNL